MRRPWFRPIPGVSNRGVEQQCGGSKRVSNSAGTTDLPVLLAVPARAHQPDSLGFSRWLASNGALCLILLTLFAMAWPAITLAAGNFGTSDALQALWRWMPLLLREGFMLNVVISFLTMLFGTLFGVLLGLAQISLWAPVRWMAKFTTQLFRNSPWLVLLFIVMLALPFEITIGNTTISIPDWAKAVFGLSLPIMANISEIVRGAVASVPSGQWEAAESMAFSRTQTLWQIVLPQCFKRMIPPWMNWYAILTMATPLVSLLGVEEIITLSRQAMESEDNHPELLMPFFGFALLVFFIYCYPIARATLALERRFAVKL